MSFVGIGVEGERGLGGGPALGSGREQLPRKPRRTLRTLITHATWQPGAQGASRLVRLASELGEMLSDALKDKLPQARVVLNDRGRTSGRQHVLAMLKRLQRRHGLKERSFHALRHYFCSKLVRCGASVEAVRVMAGHSSLAITQRYVHAASADLRTAIAKLSGNG